jgi:hypothetical protein
MDDHEDNHAQQQQKEHARPQNPALSIPGQRRRQLVTGANVAEIRSIFYSRHAGLHANAQLAMRSSQNRCIPERLSDQFCSQPERLLTHGLRFRRFCVLELDVSN